MTDDRQTLIDRLARARWDQTRTTGTWDVVDDRVRAVWRGVASAELDALLAVPVPLLREIAAATKPCETCGQFAGSIHEGQMPGHVYGSNWDWVPCQTCHGSGRVPAVDRAAILAALGRDLDELSGHVVDRAALLAALGYEQVGWVDEQYDGLLYEMGLADTRGCLPVWAARVSEETP